MKRACSVQGRGSRRTVKAMRDAQSASPTRRIPLACIEFNGQPQPIYPAPLKTVVIDAMGEVNCLKKEAGMKTLKDLSESFVKRIKYVVNTHFGADTNPQNEIKVAFDPYLKDKEGRKHQTQLKRAGGSTAQPKSY